MSSDRYAVISANASVSLLTKFSLTFLDKGATFEDAVNRLVKGAPPKTIKGVYILTDTDFQVCRRSVETVQKAGYTVVEVIESLRLAVSSMIYNVPMKDFAGNVIFVMVEELGEYPITQTNGAILRKCENGWQFKCADKLPLEALAEFPSVSDIVYRNETSENYDKVLNYIFPGRKLHRSSMDRISFVSTFFRNRINDGNFDSCEMLPYCFYDLVVEFGDKVESIILSADVPPFTVTKTIDVGNAPTVQIIAYESENSKVLVKTFKFTNTKLQTVAITVTVDKTLLPQVTLKTIASQDSDVVSTVSATQPTVNSIDVPTINGAANGKKNRSQRRKQARLNAAKNGGADGPNEPTVVTEGYDDEVDTNRPIMTLPKEMDQLNLDTPSPKTVLTFTSDNRVLIEADETYNGDKEILAYVRLQSGKAPEVGQKAFDALKTYPDSVFYGITWLLATDFDPDHPDPFWRFKTARDSDGKVVIRGVNGVTTFPIVLFGLVVRSTLLYIQEHVKCEITSLGIRLPPGCAVSDADLKNVSKHVDVDSMLLVD